LRPRASSPEMAKQGSILVNPLRRPDFRSQRGLSPRRFHRRFPDYAPTPLRELPRLAARLGVGHLFVKDESMRLDLPAFKMPATSCLGAFWTPAA